MQRHISVREANQHLSRYIEAVNQGEEVVITRRGVPVAKLVGMPSSRTLTPEQREARERSQRRMLQGYRLGGEKPDRDLLHER